MFLRSVGLPSMDYMALYHRRRLSSINGHVEISNVALCDVFDEGKVFIRSLIFVHPHLLTSLDPPESIYFD
jgi:hypothetical protein